MKKSYLVICFIALLLSILKPNNKQLINNDILLADKIVLPGDVNNDNKITAQDYVLIRKYILKQINFSNEEFRKADYNSDNKITAQDYVLVKKILMEDIKVSSITLNTNSKTMDAGTTFKLSTTIYPDNAKNKTISYTSSNPIVATVSNDGQILAKHDGETTITVKTSDGNKTANCLIKVQNGNIHLFGWSQVEADKQFGPILDGLFNGKTKETITDKDIGKSFNMHFPDMAYVNGKIYAYYITYNTKTGKGGVGLAISNDGINFENKGCVIEPDQDYDRNGAYFAGVWIDNGTYYLVYESKGDEKSKYTSLENVALATSSDGINWTKKGVILYKNTNVSWQKANVGTPDLYKTGDTWYLTFHGYDYTDCQIGVAYGKDLTNLTVHNNPVIPTEDNTLHSGTTGRRDVIYIDGWYYMVYEISTDANGNFGNAKWTHQFARSKDMINWTSVSIPLITQKNVDGTDKNGFGYDGPCWVIIDDHIYVYFRDTNNATTRAELTLK